MNKLFINGKQRNIYKNNDGSYYYKQGEQNIDASHFFKKGGTLKTKYKYLDNNNNKKSFTLELPNIPLNNFKKSKKITGGFKPFIDDKKLKIEFETLINLIPEEHRENDTTLVKKY